MKGRKIRREVKERKLVRNSSSQRWQMFKRYIYPELKNIEHIHELKYPIVPHKCVQYVCVHLNMIYARHSNIRLYFQHPRRSGKYKACLCYIEKYGPHLYNNRNMWHSRWHSDDYCDKGDDDLWSQYIDSWIPKAVKSKKTGFVLLQKRHNHILLRDNLSAEPSQGKTNVCRQDF